MTSCRYFPALNVLTGPRRKSFPKRQSFLHSKLLHGAVSMATLMAAPKGDSFYCLFDWDAYCDKIASNAWLLEPDM